MFFRIVHSAQEVPLTDVVSPGNFNVTHPTGVPKGNKGVIWGCKGTSFQRDSTRTSGRFGHTRAYVKGPNRRVSGFEGTCIGVNEKNVAEGVGSCKRVMLLVV